MPKSIAFPHPPSFLRGINTKKHEDREYARAGVATHAAVMLSLPWHTFFPVLPATIWKLPYWGRSIEMSAEKPGCKQSRRELIGNATGLFGAMAKWRLTLVLVDMEEIIKDGADSKLRQRKSIGS